MKSAVLTEIHRLELGYWHCRTVVRVIIIIDSNDIRPTVSKDMFMRCAKFQPVAVCSQKRTSCSYTCRFILQQEHQLAKQFLYNNNKVDSTQRV